MVNVTDIEPAEHIKWLSVYLDLLLTFKYHIEKWCGKAIKVTENMRQHNAVKWEVAPGSLVTAIIACMLPIATFGGDVL